MGDRVKVLVIDDEKSIRTFLKTALSAQSYQVINAASGQTGIETALAEKPDIILLDLGLPDIDGVEVTRQVRQLLQTTIIIVSVRGSEGDKIAALDAGADDYLVKPFAIGELLARIRAALRRTSQLSGEPVFNSLDLTVDLMSRRVTVGQKDVQLTSNEYGLLHLLITHVDRVLTHHYLLQGVWGSGYENDFHLLQVNISRLRVKIESDPAQPKLIITEPGVGYVLKKISDGK